jgi:hypothetical protein
MSRLYLYKLLYIDGTAPCDQDGLLSLAICKPAIRRTAQPGDLVFGVAATGCIPGNPLVYVGRVDAALSGSDYYGGQAFADRRDRIYARDGDGFRLRPGITFHTTEDAKRRDLGIAPDWPNARVLFFKDYAFFGCDGPTDYLAQFPRIARMVATLGQGHRVNHGDDVRAELHALYRWALERRTKPAQIRKRRLPAECCRV